MLIPGGGGGAVSDVVRAKKYSPFLLYIAVELRIGRHTTFYCYILLAFYCMFYMLYVHTWNTLS